MPIKIIRPTPQDFHLDDLVHIERWMCRNCGLILDYKFEPGEAGWPRFEPGLHVPDYDVDEDGNVYEIVKERKEFCPRCGTLFDASTLAQVIVRETAKLSDFFQPGDGEGINLEFKEDFATDNIRSTIAAFATTQGGKIILGITKQGIPAGYQGEEKIETTEGKDKIELRIRGVVSGIDPKPQYRVHIVDDEAGQHFVVIVVPKGASPLYAISSKFYIREEDQTRGLTTQEVLQIMGKGHKVHPK